VAQPPNDAISSLVFPPNSPNRLLVSSWDKNVYLYEVVDGAEEATLVKTFEHRAPVLDVCFGASQDEAFSAGLDRQVTRCARRHMQSHKARQATNHATR
jgi:cell cycle arrest protein BUB3